MADLKENPVITADGDYTLDGLRPGREYLLTAKGNWSGGGTLKLGFLSGPFGTLVYATDAEWTADAEARFVAPENSLTLTLSGSSSNELKVTIVPIVR